MANNLHRAKPVRKPIPVSLRVIMKRLKIDNPSYLLDFARRVRDVESSGGTKKENPNSNAKGIYQWMTSDFGEGEKKGTIESATHNLIKSYNKEGIEIPDWLLSLDRNAGILRQNTGYTKTLTQKVWHKQVLDLQPHMEDALFWSYLDQQPGTNEKWLTITYGNNTPWPKKNDKPRYWGMLDAYTQNHHRGGEKVEKEKFRDVNIRKKFDLPAYHKDENPFQPALPMSDIRLDEELHAPYQLYELPTLLNEEPILRGIPEEIRMNTGLESLQRQSGGSMTRGYLEKEVYDPWKFITADTGEYILDFYTGERRRLDPMERNIREMKYRDRLETMPTREGIEYGDNWWNDPSLPIGDKYNKNRIKEAEERDYRSRVMEAQHRGAEILPHNRRFGGLVSLANGGNPYAYEDMEDVYREDMYDPPQETQESYGSRSDDSSAEETSVPFSPRSPSLDPRLSGDLMTYPQQEFPPVDNNNQDTEEGWFSPGWGWRAAKRAAGVVGSGLVNALTGIPASMVMPIATVGHGMFQHQKNIRDYGLDYRNNADLVAQLKKQGKFVDIEGPSREWWDEDSQEEFSSPWWKRRGMVTPDLGLRRLDQPFNEPVDMRYGRAYKAGGLISLQAGGNPIANNFTKYIQEGINSGIRSMVANAYAQGNIPPPSSPQLNQSQLLNQGLTMAPNTANRPVPQQPQQPPAQSNISNVYAQSTQPQSYYMQPNQIR